MAIKLTSTQRKLFSMKELTLFEEVSSKEIPKRLGLLRKNRDKYVTLARREKRTLGYTIQSTEVKAQLFDKALNLVRERISPKSKRSKTDTKQPKSAEKRKLSPIKRNTLLELVQQKKERGQNTSMKARSNASRGLRKSNQLKRANQPRIQGHSLAQTKKKQAKKDSK